MGVVFLKKRQEAQTRRQCVMSYNASAPLLRQVLVPAQNCKRSVRAGISVFAKNTPPVSTRGVKS